jgi:2-keto-3-deoxy-L-rhamnonate aldolase RhmA
MRTNTALAAWREDKQTIGCWLSLANAHSAESMANLGFDWVCVDLQPLSGCPGMNLTKS